MITIHIIRSWVGYRAYCDSCKYVSKQHPVGKLERIARTHAKAKHPDELLGWQTYDHLR